MVLYREVALLMFIFVFCLNASGGNADTTPKGWENQLKGTLSFTQNRYTDWQKDGNNSWNWNINIKGRFEKNEDKYRWVNKAQLNFGKSKVARQMERKASDELKLESVYTFKLGMDPNPYTALTFQSQFTRGYKYDRGGKTKTPVSDWFDPAYLVESSGFGLRPSEHFITRFGAALKQTITRNYPVPYADDPATEKTETFKNEVGLESVTDINMKLSERIVYESNIEFFSNLEALSEVDINWNNTLSSSLSELLIVTFNYRILYDKDVYYKRQIKQTLALGLSYTFL